MIIRRAACALALVPLTLAGCSSSTGGSGTVTSSAPSSPATSTGPGSSSASASPSPSASTSAHTVPPGKYARTPMLATAYGDPVLVDWCAAIGTDFATSTGLSGNGGGLQFVPGCGFDFKKGTTTEASLELLIEDPSIEKEPHPPLQQTTRVGGVTVEKFGLASGICPRLIRAGPIDAIVEAIHGAASATSPVMCQLADLAVARFAQVNAQPGLAKLIVPTPSYTDISLCKVAQVTSTSPIPNVGKAKYSTMSLGTSCSVEAPNYIYTLDVARVPDVLSYALYKTIKVGTHTLQGSNDNTHLKCDVDDIGPKIPGTPNSHEVLEISLRAHYGSAQLCGQVATYLGKLLDTAGIK